MFYTTKSEKLKCKGLLGKNYFQSQRVDFVFTKNKKSMDLFAKFTKNSLYLLGEKIKNLKRTRKSMASVLHSPTSRFFYSTKNGKTSKSSRIKIFASFRSGDHDDTTLKAAVSAASIRFHESLRSDPLFIDPYAGCFLSSISSQKEIKEQYPITTCASSPCYYSLTTKFIDDKLLSLITSSDELKQIVLLTDGMDTRPYRLSWPRSSVIYDISPGRIFKEASQRLVGVGAKISKGCVLLHVPLESSDIQEALNKKGFSGNRASLWVLQGLPLMTLAGFENVLATVSSLAMEGCTFMGELPGFLLGAEMRKMDTQRETLEKLFMSHGFQVDVVEHDVIARNLHLDLPPGDYNGIFYMARQLRLSDSQMDAWRGHFGRLEEEADEEGFEEM
ncbi:uncharacterized protein A4U43_C02F21310 [Asparagus officinalis]|uniref:Uncharacterized protein n=1 Tax=Asparagus officinalis TaxID=4686 RepID=A0A5P1FNY9_ASPOF|nr:uncharacterized protein LOC109831826 isoform X1 [Asparagus officinalis]ONK78679.1 uncharacterized protein A4U43_C02F21310 [Asparagus officinalis]